MTDEKPENINEDPMINNAMAVTKRLMDSFDMVEDDHGYHPILMGIFVSNSMTFLTNRLIYEQLERQVEAINRLAEVLEKANEKSV